MLSLKWNNIYWIETVTPNSGFLYPTTYNLKGNHSNNIISIIHNTYVDYCRNNILFSLINLLILIHCIRYQYLLLQIIRKLRDHFRVTVLGGLSKIHRIVRNVNQRHSSSSSFPITPLKWNLPLSLNMQFIKTTNKIEIKFTRQRIQRPNSISVCYKYFNDFPQKLSIVLAHNVLFFRHIFIFARNDKIGQKNKVARRSHFYNTLLAPPVILEIPFEIQFHFCIHQFKKKKIDQ